MLYSCPWIGLIAKEVSYGPVTISKVNIEKSGKLVFCEPGETISGTVHYKVDAAKFESWNLHHIIVGLRDQDAQNCILHSLGVCDDKGRASFSFVAPQEKGIYELCFDYHRAMFCSKAIEEWHAHSPSQKATIGIVVVE